MVQADRVVPVIRFVDGKRRVGSGYRIAGRFVLTAAHCVRGSGLRVWLPDGERDARVVANGGTENRLGAAGNYPHIWSRIGCRGASNQVRASGS